MWLVYGEESGELQEFKTKKEALAFIRDVNRFDKENGLSGETWTITKETTPMPCCHVRGM